jgi:HNH endonuclease
MTKDNEQAEEGFKDDCSVLQDWSGLQRWVKQDDGYARVLVPGRGVMQEHRLVVEKYLGQRLEPHETINHIDGNRLHNDIANLEVLSMDEARRADQARRTKQARTFASLLAKKYSFAYDEGYKLYFYGQGRYWPDDNFPRDLSPMAMASDIKESFVRLCLYDLKATSVDQKLSDAVTQHLLVRPMAGGLGQQIVE